VERAAIEDLAGKIEASLSGRDRDVVAAAAGGLEEGTKIFAERRMDRGIRAALAGRSIDRLEL
jgi:molecular chaperone HscA